jgi:AcrR family transcriptional regulator
LPKTAQARTQRKRSASDPDGRQQKESSEHRGRGRPRDPAADEAILTATLDELRDAGYNGMSMQTIADRAGVTKPTIYRRWPGKPALAVAALAELASAEHDVDTTDARAALSQELHQIHNNLQVSGTVALLGTLVAEQERHPEFIEVYRERVVRRREARLDAILRSAQARGEIRKDADRRTAVLLLLGFGLTSYIVSDEERKPGWLEAAVDTVLYGLKA